MNIKHMERLSLILTQLCQAAHWALAAILIASLLLCLFFPIPGVSPAVIPLHPDQFALGLAALCLTRYFVRGAALEQDVEGLV